jgi:hypothetical protein
LKSILFSGRWKPWPCVDRWQETRFHDISGRTSVTQGKSKVRGLGIELWPAGEVDKNTNRSRKDWVLREKPPVLRKANPKNGQLAVHFVTAQVQNQLRSYASTLSPIM